MPESKNEHAQTKRGTWWIPLIVGFLMLMVPGGVYASPVFFILAIIMRRRKKSPETPHSLLPLINITPNPHS